jgi:hypothetical protein
MILNFEKLLMNERKNHLLKKLRKRTKNKLPSKLKSNNDKKLEETKKQQQQKEKEEKENLDVKLKKNNLNIFLKKPVMDKKKIISANNLPFFKLNRRFKSLAVEKECIEIRKKIPSLSYKSIDKVCNKEKKHLGINDFTRIPNIDIKIIEKENIKNKIFSISNLKNHYTEKKVLKNIKKSIKKDLPIITQTLNRKVKTERIQKKNENLRHILGLEYLNKSGRKRKKIKEDKKMKENKKMNIIINNGSLNHQNLLENKKNDNMKTIKDLLKKNNEEFKNLIFHKINDINHKFNMQKKNKPNKIINFMKAKLEILEKLNQI